MTPWQLGACQITQSDWIQASWWLSKRIVLWAECGMTKRGLLCLYAIGTETIFVILGVNCKKTSFILRSMVFLKAGKKTHDLVFKACIGFVLLSCSVHCLLWMAMFCKRSDALLVLLAQENALCPSSWCFQKTVITSYRVYQKTVASMLKIFSVPLYIL